MGSREFYFYFLRIYFMLIELSHREEKLMIWEGGKCKGNDLEQGRGDRLKHSNEEKSIPCYREKEDTDLNK